MMQLSDGRVTTLVKQRTLYCSYITTCGDKIYQTNRDTNTVTCYTIKGKKLWKYKDVAVLNDPRGVTVDNNSNVYVTSCSSHKVVVLEPDGRQGRQLISSDDGLADPNGIYYNKSKNSLFVANFGKGFLYNMY
jgi:DNA-binding beta-propeller fold protein YncE